MTKTKNPKKLPYQKKLRGDSSHTTSASILIDAHYERLNIRRRWTKQRLDRLCGFLRMNYGEVASLIHASHQDLMNGIYGTRPLNGSIALLLTIIENRYLSDFTKDTVTNLFNFTDHGQ